MSTAGPSIRAILYMGQNATTQEGDPSEGECVGGLHRACRPQESIGRAIRWHADSRFARPAIRDDGHRLVKGTATLLVALLVSTLLWSILFVLPAGAELSETGPVDPETGFPAWLEDGKGLRLEPCFTYPNCPQDGGGSSSVDSDQGGDVVYWSATSKISSDDGAEALLAMRGAGRQAASDRGSGRPQPPHR